MRLLGKTALVTGAGRGIGLGCAIEIARAGADVAINDHHRTPQVERVVAEIQSLAEVLSWLKALSSNVPRVKASLNEQLVV